MRRVGSLFQGLAFQMTDHSIDATAIHRIFIPPCTCAAAQHRQNKEKFMNTRYYFTLVRNWRDSSEGVLETQKLKRKAQDHLYKSDQFVCAPTAY
jgi:hypothetical protein